MNSISYRLGDGKEGEITDPAALRFFYGKLYALWEVQGGVSKSEQKQKTNKIEGELKKWQQSK